MCGQAIARGEAKVCVACKGKAVRITEPKCKCCGKQLEVLEQEFCFDCSRKEHYFERGFSLWQYDSLMQNSIAKFKYHHRREYVDFYADEFVKQYGEQILGLGLDGMVAVPVHWTRYVERGYNQAQVFAEAISARTGIPVLDGLLVRQKKTIAQKKLDDKQRSRNLEQAFAISERWKDSADNLNRLMIIDDIYTTGSTINLCAKTIKETGVSEVYFGVLCIGAGC